MLPASGSLRQRTAHGPPAKAILAAVLLGSLITSCAGRQPRNPTVTPTPSLSKTSSEVERSYLRHWEVWTEASFKLDPSLLGEVAAGPALETLTTQIETQKAKNQPVRVRVEHDYRVTLGTDDQGEDVASIDDRYLNHSVRLDPTTLEPIEADPQEQVHATFAMRLLDGRWKVFEIIEYR